MSTEERGRETGYQELPAGVAGSSEKKGGPKSEGKKGGEKVNRAHWLRARTDIRTGVASEGERSQTLKVAGKGTSEGGPAGKRGILKKKTVKMLITRERRRRGLGKTNI